MRVLGLTLFLLLGLTDPLQAHDFFPLCTGSVWEYVGEETMKPYVIECTGWEDVWGIRCGVREYRDFPDVGLRNFWYEAADGALVLRGAYRSVEAFGFIYDPGIRLISASPFLGETLCSSFDIYSLPDSVYSETFTVCFQVVEEGLTPVPAGTFYAYAIDGVPSMPGRGQYDLLGRKIGPAPRQAWMWFAEDVGIVQSTSHDLYRLVSYSLPPSSAGVASWGRVRALFR